MPHRTIVLPKRTGPSEARFHALLVAGLARVGAKIGIGTLADAMGRTPRALSNVMGGSHPDAKAVFDALLADATVLDELLADYGYRLASLVAEAANDISTGCDLIDAGAELVRSQDDGFRDHGETLRVADKLRGVMPRAAAIIHEADVIRGHG